MPANPNEKAQSAMDAARAKNAESAESACIDAKYFFLAIGTSLVAFILASFVGVVPISMDTALKWSCIVMIAIAAGKLIYDRFEQRIIAAVIAAEAYLKSAALAIAIVLIDPVVRFIRSLFAEKIEYITTFTFDSAYSLVQGKEGAFLAACTKAIKVATCIFVHPGSVVLGIKHLGDEAAAAIKEIQHHGLWINSPSFPEPLVPISSETRALSDIKDDEWYGLSVTERAKAIQNKNNLPSKTAREGEYKEGKILTFDVPADAEQYLADEIDTKESMTQKELEIFKAAWIKSKNKRVSEVFNVKVTSCAKAGSPCEAYYCKLENASENCKFFLHDYSMDAISSDQVTRVCPNAFCNANKIDLSFQ